MVFDEDEADRKARKRYFDACRRLKTDKPICPYCGRMNPHGIQDHHILGRRYAALTLPLCSYCHDLETDDMKNWPQPVSGTPLENEVAGRLLLALASFAENAAPFLRQCAEAATGLPPGVREMMLAFADYLDGKVGALREHGRAALGYSMKATDGGQQ